MKLKDCDIGDELFSHTDPDDGTVRIINATKLRAWAEKRYTPIRYQLDQEWIDYVRANRGLEEWKLRRLRDPYLHKPTLLVEMEDKSALTVDGHHRIVRLFELGERSALGIVVPLGEWEWAIVKDEE